MAAKINVSRQAPEIVLGVLQGPAVALEGDEDGAALCRVKDVPIPRGVAGGTRGLLDPADVVVISELGCAQSIGLANATAGFVVVVQVEARGIAEIGVGRMIDAGQPILGVVGVADALVDLIDSKAPVAEDIVT